MRVSCLSRVASLGLQADAIILYTIEDYTMARISGPNKGFVPVVDRLERYRDVGNDMEDDVKDDVESLRQVHDDIVTGGVGVIDKDDLGRR
jgi:hypothetical protein